MKKRNHAFDLLCGVCIIRMMTLHIMQFCGRSDDDWWVAVMGWTYFFMSFFFFKAGYFNKSLAGPWRPYVWDKTKRLIVPYISAGLIGNAIYFAFLPAIISRYGHPVEPLSWAMVWEKSNFIGNGPTWFLFSFYSAYVLVHFIEKVPHLHWVVLAFPMVSYWLFTQGNPLWMSFNNVFMGIFFFMLGRVWRRFMEHIGHTTTIYVSLLLIAYFVAANILWPGEYTMATNKFTGHALLTVVNTTAILCGLAGLLIAIDIPRVPVVNFIGEHSMVYFISHYPMLYFYKWTHLSFGRSIFGHYDDVLILVPVLFVICTYLVPYIEGHPVLSGRWKKA